MRLVADPSERQGRERAGRRSELEALRQAVRQHLQRSTVVHRSNNPELQGELVALTIELEDILMRLNLKLAEHTRMQ